MTILPQIIVNLKKSLNYQLPTYFANRICILRSKDYCKHRTASYCIETKKLQINRHIDDRHQPHVDRNENTMSQHISMHDEGPNAKLTHLRNVLTNDKFAEIKYLYPQPMQSLLAIYVAVKHDYRENCISITYNYSNKSTTHHANCIIEIKWPEEKRFSSFGPNKRMASYDAALSCLYWLHVNKKIKGLKPILYKEKDAISLMHAQETVNIEVDEPFKKEMRLLIDDFNDKIKPVLDLPPVLSPDESLEETDDESLNLTEPLHEQQQRNSVLLENLQKQRNFGIDLPIAKFREEIVQSIQENQVVLVEGDTGCGKSTQVPQFIFEEYVKNNRAHECNIVVSVPRRVVAISLAQTIAKGRSEALGDVVGYHVRFDKILPPNDGSMLFCTNGMLLRKMHWDSNLSNISHVILDEVHERGVHVDMLLKLYKDILADKPDLKLIIMSATMNTEVLQRYFNCKVVKVTGKQYPVNMHFMEDIKILKSMPSEINELERYQIPYENIVNLVQWIINNKPPGGILCFLPGWQEIWKLYSMLFSKDSKNLQIFTLHSKVPNNIQQRVFHRVPPGKTKVILATDIAETGITIEDITYVIDIPIKRDVEWSDDKCLPSLTFNPISRANIIQRKGRAGRVRPGESFHFITRKEYEKLDAYPKAAILKTSLDEPIIISKTFSNQNLYDFFGSLIEPPNRRTLGYSIQNLKELQILDDDGNLTSLGKRISHFTIDTKLSKALIYSTIFQCLNPVVNIITLFSSLTSIYSSMDKKANVISDFRTLKGASHNTSDHISILQYFNSMENKDLFDFINSNFRLADRNTLRKVYMVYMEDLLRSNILASMAELRETNKHANNNEMIRAVLYAATNNLLKRNYYGYRKGWFTGNANTLMAEDRKVVLLDNGSVNYNRTKWPVETLVYIYRMNYTSRRSQIVSDTSMISPLSVLLFNRSEAQWQNIQTKEENKIEISVQNLRNVKFSCERETGKLLLDLRDVLWSVVNYIIDHEGNELQEENLSIVKDYKNELVDFLSRMLKESAKYIDNADP